MFSEMRSAALLTKGVAKSASALPAAKALAMATINGARALGLQQETGSLEPGKAADIVAVDLMRVNTQPVYHPISQLVYAAGRDQVTHVWVAGRPVVSDSRLTTLDDQQLLSRSNHWRERIMMTDPGS
jgi:5-methylthioadenosine/S-adenosylhomocysteine deaminase